MPYSKKKEIRWSGRIALSLIGIKLETKGMVKIYGTGSAGQQPDRLAIEDQSNPIDGDIVEEIDLAKFGEIEEL